MIAGGGAARSRRAARSCNLVYVPTCATPRRSRPRSSRVPVVSCTISCSFQVFL